MIWRPDNWQIDISDFIMKQNTAVSNLCIGTLETLQTILREVFPKRALPEKTSTLAFPRLEACPPPRPTPWKEGRRSVLQPPQAIWSLPFKAGGQMASTPGCLLGTFGATTVASVAKAFHPSEA